MMHSEKQNKAKVVYAFGSLPGSVVVPQTPSVNRLNRPRFLRYFFGTSKEVDELDIFDKQNEIHISDLRKNISSRNWLMARRNTLDMSRNLEEMMGRSEIKQTKSKFNFDRDYHGTLAYVVTSIPLTIIFPYVGLPLLIDSAVRVNRMALRHEPPVGIVGTAREFYQYLNSKSIKS